MEQLNPYKFQNSKLLLIFSIVLSASLTFALGIHVKNIIDKALDSSVHTQISNNYTTDIRFYDEVLSNIALLAATTGDLQWEKQYRLAETKLDNAIKNAMLLDSTGQSSQKISEINNANYKLVAMENSLFDLVRNKKLSEAQALINSAEFKKQKEIYAKKLSSFIKLHEAEADKIQSQLQQEAKQSEWYFGFLVLILSLLLFFIERLLHKNTNRIVELNNRFNLVAKATNDCIYDWDLTTNKIWWNEALSNTYNYPPELTETDLDFWEDKIHPKDKEALLQSIQNVFDEKLENWSAEYRFKRADGSYATIFDRGLVEYDKARNPVRWIGSKMDITKQKLADEEIKKSDLKYRTLYESINDAIFLMDNGIFLDCNSQTEKIFGCTKKDIIGYSPIDFSPEKQPDGRLSSEKGMEFINGALNGKPQNFEWIHCHLDKSLFYAEVTLNKIALGGEVFLQAIVRDITQRKQAEEKINKIQEQLQESIKASGVGLWHLNLITNEAYMSPEWKKQIGFDDDELKNELETYKNHLHPDDVKAIEDSSKELIEGKCDTYEGEYRFLHKDGSYLCIYAKASVKRDKNGKPLYLYGSHLDITERKKAEEKIKMLAQAIQNTLECIVITNENFVINYVNEAFLKTYGYQTEEIINQPIQVIHSAKNNPEVQKEILAQLEKKQSWHGEIINTAKGGRDFPVAISISPILDDGGKATSFVAIKRDITEQKKAEEKIKLLAQAIESSQDSICITDIDNKLKFVNKALVKLYGYSQEELIDQSVEMLRPKNLKELTNDITQGTIQKGAWQNEVINIKKDGTEFPIYLSTSPVYDENGNLISFIGIARDITKQKKQEIEILNLNASLEQKVKDRTKQLASLNNNLADEIESHKLAEIELATAKAELELSIASKNEFFSRVSHELRTPLNSILGFGQLLEMGELDPKHKKGVNQIMTSGKQLLALVNNVLLLSKIESNNIITSQEPVQLKGILLETIEMCQHFTKENNIELALEILEEENLYVLADYQKLTQALLNLLNNAIKFNHQNGLVKIKTEKMPNEKVRISITDTGKGIATNAINKLFKPFQRIETEISDMTGTGLGLAVTKKLIEAMNGTIGVESTLGKGSTFWLELPQIAGQLDQHEKEAIFITAIPAKSTKTGTLLYIENNSSNLRLIKQVIDTHRPAIKLITSLFGKDALKLTLDYRPSVILLDLDLSDLHGSEVLKLLQNEPKTKNIPVVVLSADASQKQITNLLAAGAKAYLTKPLVMLEFLKVLDEAMNNE
jgi:PAS domain S-box-containing protein